MEVELQEGRDTDRDENVWSDKSRANRILEKERKNRQRNVIKA